MKIFKLSLTENEVNIILVSLGEQPAKNTMGVILNVQNQCRGQVPPPNEPPPADPPIDENPPTEDLEPEK